MQAKSLSVSKSKEKDVVCSIAADNRVFHFDFTRSDLYQFSDLLSAMRGYAKLDYYDVEMHVDCLEIQWRRNNPHVITFARGYYDGEEWYDTSLVLKICPVSVGIIEKIAVLVGDYIVPLPMNYMLDFGKYAGIQLHRADSEYIRWLAGYSVAKSTRRYRRGFSAPDDYYREYAAPTLDLLFMVPQEMDHAWLTTLRLHPQAVRCARLYIAGECITPKGRMLVGNIGRNFETMRVCAVCKCVILSGCACDRTPKHSLVRTLFDWMSPELLHMLAFYLSYGTLQIFADNYSRGSLAIQSLGRWKSTPYEDLLDYWVQVHHRNPRHYEAIVGSTRRTK